MKRFIVGAVLGYMLASGILQAQEFLNDLQDSSTPVMNEELRKINQTLRDHETRITALEP
jgi:hypothetical protein